MNKILFSGIFFAIFAAVTYGMNPFFGIPLYQEGLTPLSVLFYRFFFAAILMGSVLLCGKGKSLSEHSRHIFIKALLVVENMSSMWYNIKVKILFVRI